MDELEAGEKVEADLGNQVRNFISMKKTFFSVNI
jgi:hypothetical protein